MWPFDRAAAIYRESGLTRLLSAVRNYLRYQLFTRGKLQWRYYRLRGKHTVAIGRNKITARVSHYSDESELRIVYGTERAVWGAVLKELRPNDVFWDVGASMGFYSLLAAHFPGVKVAAFEPHPATVKRLRENVMLNKKSNITVLEVALSDADRRAWFEPVDPELTRGTAHLGSGKAGGAIEVELRRGDSLVASGVLAGPDVIKIDVEGAEHLVVKGMRRALANCRSLFCEVHPGIKRYGSPAEELERDLRDLGFGIERIQERGDGTYHIWARRR